MAESSIECANCGAVNRAVKKRCLQCGANIRTGEAWPMSERDRNILSDRDAGMTLAAIAKKYKISPARVEQIIWELKRRMNYE